MRETLGEHVYDGDHFVARPPVVRFEQAGFN